MFIEKIKSDGLAHFSYVVGDGAVAAVIDPRRDCEVYVESARQHGCRITHIFETHRNEDLISGSSILAGLTGATVHHGPNADGDVVYAETVREGDSFEFANLRLKVLETPGHTDDSISIIAFDAAFGEVAVGVFSGDALFVGDVGRTDFYPDRADEVAGLLFDSLQKLCTLGDQTILWPAHGAGSVCGDNMADRDFSTIGYERMNNPLLQIRQRDAFITRKLDEEHDQPPYFRRMEKLNLQGAAAGPRTIAPRPVSPDELDRIDGPYVVVDVRGVADFLGAHLPGSLAIPHDMLSAFAGWLLDSEDTIVLLADDIQQAADATRQLGRIGYDHVHGYLTSTLADWAATGRKFRALPVVDAVEVAARVNNERDDWQLLDVRSSSEAADGMISGAKNIYVGELPTQLGSLQQTDQITVMCASGARATIAASILLRSGFKDVDVFLGSSGAWAAHGYATV